MENTGICLTFISNFLNHHQQYLCEAFYELLGSRFRFVETVPFSEERRAGGWTMPGDRPYLLRAWESEVACREAEALMCSSDAVIIGSAPDSWILPRLKAGGITFRYHERWHKEPLSFWKKPRAMAGGWLHHGRFPSLYLLCAGAYAAADAADIGCFRGRAYQWGYFPETRYYTEETLLAMKKKQTPVILWAGRMLELKHGETALEACAIISRQGLPFRLLMVGDGPKRTYLEQLSVELGIADRTEFTGSLSSDGVRREMERADIFLFTSDRREGWGAVVNEAMNSGCGVIASVEAGASPCLIRDRENGFLFPCGDAAALARGIGFFLKHPECRQKFGLRAYGTIRDLWSPRSAAGNFLQLYQSIAGLSGGRIPEEGPGSIALILHSGDLVQNMVLINEGEIRCEDIMA